MKFSTNSTMTKILDELFSTYSERVPNVRKITSEMVNNGMVKDQNEIINDHVLGVHTSMHQAFLL